MALLRRLADENGRALNSSTPIPLVLEHGLFDFPRLLHTWKSQAAIRLMPLLVTNDMNVSSFFYNIEDYRIFY